MRPLAVSGLPVSDVMAPPIRDEERASIRFLHRLVDVYIRGYHNVSVVAPPQVPMNGPAILVCNHVSSLDPMLLQWATPRLITWMMAREYYVPGTRWLFDIIRTIPVERSKRDLVATRAAMRALAEGQLLGIFPEGRLAEGISIGPFQTGVAMMALKAGVDVYPASVEGTMRDRGMLEPFFFPQRARVAFGPRVELAEREFSKEAIERATGRIREAVCRVHDRVK